MTPDAVITAIACMQGFSSGSSGASLVTDAVIVTVGDASPAT
jgi:hypothetical protein